MDDTYLCHQYRLKLKQNLQDKLELFDIHNLDNLQKAAERADSILYGSRDKANGKRSSNHERYKKPYYQERARREHNDDPMDLDNMQARKSFRRLPEEEREKYRKNGWCTFCRSKEHPTKNCDHPSFNRNVYERNQKRINSTKDADTIGGSRTD
jgi:hypothetical protein